MKANDNRVFIRAPVNMADVSEPEHNIVEVVPASGEIISERDFVLLLISLYRDSPVLWNVNNTGYTDKRKRTIALQRITRALQMYKPNYTKIELKKKINSLRTNFNKEKNKLDFAKRSTTSANGITEPTLWYYREMLFLCEPLCETESSEYSVSHQTKTYPYVRKRTKIITNNETIDLPKHYFQKPEYESELIAKGWIMKLRGLAPDQRLFAEKIINDVLFEAEMTTLTKETVRITSAILSAPSNTLQQYT